MANLASDAAEFIERVINIRDTLAIRKLRKENLSIAEQLTLSILNKAVEQIMVAPKALPQNVRDLVERVLAANKR